MYPTSYPFTCKFCAHPCALYDMVWECQSTPSLTPNPHPTYEQWAGQMTSSDLPTQRRLVVNTEAASEAQGYFD